MSHQSVTNWVVRNPDGSHDVYPYEIFGIGAKRVFGAHIGHFPPGYSIFEDPPGTGGGANGGNQIGGDPRSNPQIGTSGGGTGGSGSSLQKAKNPITGPEGPPPAEGCDPAMSTVVQQDSLTSGDFKIEKTLAQPLVGGMMAMPIYSDSTTTGKVVFNVEAYIEHKVETGESGIYHPGSGDGMIVVHPPELQKYHLYGSRVTPGSAWPTNLSEVTFLFHNDDGDGSHAEAVSRMAFGVPLHTSVKPGDGAYFEFVNATLDLCINFTDEDGVDSTGVPGTAASKLKTNGAFKASSGIIWDIDNITESDTADWNQVMYLTGGSGQTVTMPTILAGDVGKIIIIANRSSNTWTVDGAGSDTIDGFTTQNILHGNTWQLMAVTTTKWIGV